MKKIMILLSLLMTVGISGKNFPIMLQVQGEVDVPVDFRDGVEETLTLNGYSLIDQKSQKEALKEQAAQRKKACYDDSCLLDTGKMLAARALIVAEVSKKAKDRYRFKARYIDFESGTTTKTKLDYYEAPLEDYRKLSSFGKKLAAGLINGKAPVIKEVVKKPEVKKPEPEVTQKVEPEPQPQKVKPKPEPQKKVVVKRKRRVKENIDDLEPRFQGFSFGVGLTLGLHGYSYNARGEDPEHPEYGEISSEVILDGIDLGVSLNTAYYFTPRIAFLMGLNINIAPEKKGDVTIKAMGESQTGNTNPLIATQVSLLIGGRYHLGSVYGAYNNYYIAGGAGVTQLTITLGSVDSDQEETASDSNQTGFILSLEGGMNMPLSGNSLDLFIVINHAILSDLDENNAGDNFDGSSLTQLAIGARYNF